MAREYFRSGLLFKAGVSIAASVTVALAFWYPLQRAHRAHIQRITQFAAHAVKSDIADEIRAQFLAQIQLAQLYGLEGSLFKQEWDSYAAIFVAHHPGYSALLLTNENLHVHFSFALAEAQPHLDTLFATDGPLQQTLREDHEKREAMLSPAFILRNGKSGHAVVAPIYHEGQHRGFLIAILDDREFLEDALNDQGGRGYGFAIVEDDQELYTLPNNDSDSEKRWAQDVELSLSGITWHIRVWPQAILLGEVEPRLPQLGLMTGAIIGMLFSTTVILAWTAYVKSQELSQARDQLEIRVQERTADLESLNKRLEAEVEERTFAEASLRDLSGHLLQLRDEEQRRLARDLHDSTAQIVGALAINLERLQEAVAHGNTSKVHALLAQSNDLAEQATADLRTISHLLHPPILDDLGLEGALPWYTVGFTNRSGIVVRLNMQDDLGRFPREIELTVFRILQESLANIYRHSGSPTAEIGVFRGDDQLTLRISDCGRGIPPGILTASGNSRAMLGVGITGMRERVRQMQGHLEIDSGAGGTCIIVVLPLNVARAPARETTWDVALDCLAKKSA
jgi:signal transduction histidine kinase